MGKKIVRNVNSSGLTTGYKVVWYDSDGCQRRKSFTLLADAAAFLATLP